MSDRFAPLHCPSTGFLHRSQARTGLSKAYTSNHSFTHLIIHYYKRFHYAKQENIKDLRKEAEQGTPH
jgi:hypothetical protein